MGKIVINQDLRASTDCLVKADNHGSPRWLEGRYIQAQGLERADAERID